MPSVPAIRIRNSAAYMISVNIEQDVLAQLATLGCNSRGIALLKAKPAHRTANRARVL